MSEMTESRLAMFEGVIALCWADHELDAEEKDAFRTMIDGNKRFSPAQRERLYASLENKISLEEVWPRITDKQDRANLLDLSGMVFLEDGEYCETEKDLYEKFLAKHMATLDTEGHIAELRQMAEAQRLRREQEKEDMKEYARQFSLVARIEKFITKFLD